MLQSVVTSVVASLSPPHTDALLSSNPDGNITTVKAVTSTNSVAASSATIGTTGSFVDRSVTKICFETQKSIFSSETSKSGSAANEQLEEKTSNIVKSDPSAQILTTLSFDKSPSTGDSVNADTSSLSETSEVVSATLDSSDKKEISIGQSNEETTKNVSSSADEYIEQLKAVPPTADEELERPVVVEQSNLSQVDQQSADCPSTCSEESSSSKKIDLLSEESKSEKLEDKTSDQEAKEGTEDHQEPSVICEPCATGGEASTLTEKDDVETPMEIFEDESLCSDKNSPSTQDQNPSAAGLKKDKRLSELKADVEAGAEQSGSSGKSLDAQSDAGATFSVGEEAVEVFEQKSRATVSNSTSTINKGSETQSASAKAASAKSLDDDDGLNSEVNQVLTDSLMQNIDDGSREDENEHVQPQSGQNESTSGHVEKVVATISTAGNDVIEQEFPTNIWTPLKVVYKVL